MLCDVVRRRRRRWAHAPVIHAASHFDQKKELHGFLFLCIRVVPFSIIMGLRLAALRAAGAPLKRYNCRETKISITLLDLNVIKITTTAT